jgi:hypothetical protein
VIFAVDPWDPSYGTSSETEFAGEDAAPEVDVDVETPGAQWQPISPMVAAQDPGTVVFVDGVRRIDARIWVSSVGAEQVAGVCASWAAGAVSCQPGRPPTIAEIEVGRTLAAAVPPEHMESLHTHHAVYRPTSATAETPEALWLAVQEQMGQAERRVAEAAAASAGDALVVLDGTLRGRDHLAGVVAMVKSHQVRYLTERPARVLGELVPGQRTPVFKILGAFDRYSWYVRLPTESAVGVPFAGVVRCETASNTELSAVVERADRVTAELQRYASEPHKDRRAPQNLYPIAGLERDLRHRLGDVNLLYRSLRLAASRSAVQLG